LFILAFLAIHVSSFTSASPKARTSFLKADTGPEETLPTPTQDVVRKVAVAGATGKTGRLVVQELLDRGIQVLGMVRNIEKAKETFSGEVANLEIAKVDLTDSDEIASSLKGCDAIIWCATGFSDEQTDRFEGLKKILGLPIAKAPKQSIDMVGVPAVAKAMLNEATGISKGYPRVVMMSSAGVTRLSWSDEKKQRFPGCADIPIVRLNPFGILGIKAESEEKLRKSGVNYCVVRPSGLNDDWPAGARPVVSQGDVAVGRINRKDVAALLVDVLSAEEACDKTFEVVGLAGYPRPRNLAPVLARLKPDSELITEDEVATSFGIMQQLVPGERQDPAALAMGQTYEQLDAGKTGRLGERGQENAEAAAPRPTG